jgi:hypothetical protein
VLTNAKTSQIFTYYIVVDVRVIEPAIFTKITAPAMIGAVFLIKFFMKGNDKNGKKRI